MLTRLVRTYLGRYRRLLLVLLVLQFVQAMGTLFLPALNAEIINKGVLTGDTAYIWQLGFVMLAITLVQVAFAIGATYCGAKAAMSFGRDVRRDLFHNVTSFSAREVGEVGAPSLITRITNDVTQVQMLVLMGCTLLVAAPITIIGGTILAINEDGPLSLILLVAIPILLLSVGVVAFRMHPVFTLMQTRIDRVNQILREQITGIRVVHAFVREPDEGRVRVRERRAHAHRVAYRPDDGVHVPDRHAHREPVERGCRLVRCRSHRERRDAGGVARRVPELSHPDPDGRDDGHLRREHGAARRGLCRASARSSTRGPRSSPRRNR